MEITLRLWLSDPRVLDGVVRPGTSASPEEVRTGLPAWLRSELRTQLQRKITSDGEPVTQEQADSFIDKALDSGALDSEGTLTFRVKGTREQIVEQILEVCELWNEPMTRAKAEAKADAAIRVMWGRRIFAWFSSAMLILAMILVFLLVIGIIAAEADPAPVIHYAPTENLEHIDVELIGGARQEIDMAAYVLTDWPVMQALTRAADRGVKVRIYLDGTQLAEREPTKVFHDLTKAHPPSRYAPSAIMAPRCTSRATKSTGECCAPAPRTFQHRDSSGRTMI